MTDRTVKVTLQAEVSQYIGGMSKASEATRTMGSEAEKLGQKKESIQQLGVASLAFGTAAAAAVVVAVGAFVKFDKAMSDVQASTHETAANMGLLRDAAISAGASTVFSATEAANAEDELAKAGVSTADILGGALTGAMSLASAGGLGVADSASIAATAMTQFGLKGSQVPHIADLLAAGAGKAQGSVQDLSMALNQGGLVAAQSGHTIEDTTATLAAFASAGLLGSDAGTSLKTAIISLESPSTQAKNVMEKYGISVYDSSGKMLSFGGIAQDLKDKLGGLTDEQRNSALATIFGTDAVRAASVLYSEGAAGIDAWTKKVNDAGYAAETAKLKLNNLSGDVEYLSGDFDSLLIKSGSGANDVLRQIVQTADTLLGAVAALPTPILSTGLAMTAIAAAVALAGGAFLLVVPKIAATRDAMKSLNVTGGEVAKKFGKGGIVIAAVAALASSFVGPNQAIQLTSDNLANLDAAVKTNNLDKLSEQFTNGGAAAEGFKDVLQTNFSDNFFLNGRGIPTFFNSITLGMFNMTKEIDQNDARFRQLGQTLAGGVTTDFKSATAQFQKYVDLAGGGNDAIKNLLSAMPDYKAALISVAAAQGRTLDDQDLYNLALGKGWVATQAMIQANTANASGLDDVSAAAIDTTGNVSKLSDAIKNFGAAQFDVENATNSFYDAFDKLKKNLDDGKGSLDQTTQAGRDTSQALLDTASSTNDLAAAQFALGDGVDVVNSTLDDGRQHIIDARVALGDTTDQAKAYADQLISTPQQVETQVKLSGVDTAKNQFQSMLAQFGQASVSVPVHAYGQGLGVYAPGHADGGAIYGPGSGTSDSLVRRLSNGEHVLTAQEVNLMGGQAAVYGFRQSLKTKQGYATPSRASYAPPNYVVAAQGGTGGGSRSATVIINPQPQMSEMAIGQAAVAQQNYELRKL